MGRCGAPSDYASSNCGGPPARPCYGPGPPQRQRVQAVRTWCTEMRASGTPPVRAIMRPERDSHVKDLWRVLGVRELQLPLPTRPTLPRPGPVSTSARPSRQAVVYRKKGFRYTAGASHHEPRKGLEEGRLRHGFRVRKPNCGDGSARREPLQAAGSLL